MTADPHIETAVRLAGAVRDNTLTHIPWIWAMDMADGINRLAARLEAAERDLAAARLCYGSFLDWCIGYVERSPGSWTTAYEQRFYDRLRDERAALAAAQQPPAEETL